jgi:hypothetical protein
MKYKHAVITRCRFDDKPRMHRYLEVSQDMLIPSFKSQVVQDFEWILMIKKADLGLLQRELDYPFTSVLDKGELDRYLKEERFVIQTRHDIDDWMHQDYIKEIQSLYGEHIDTHDKFLIQSQPVKMMYHTGDELVMRRYHERKNSMFLTLCQREVTNTVLDRKHALMWEIAPTVFNVPDGMTKWVIHGNNISCNRAKDFKITNDKEQ